MSGQRIGICRVDQIAIDAVSNDFMRRTGSGGDNWQAKTHRFQISNAKAFKGRCGVEITLGVARRNLGVGGAAGQGDIVGQSVCSDQLANLGHISVVTGQAANHLESPQ